MQNLKIGQIIIIGLLVFMTISSVATAQTQLNELQTLNDLVQLAIINDKNIQLTELQLLEVQAGLAGIDSALDPRFILNSEYKLENLANNQQIMMAQQPRIILEQFFESISDQFPAPSDPPEWLPTDLPEWIPSLPEYDLTDTAHTTTLSATIYQQLGLNNELQLAKNQAELGLELVSLQQQQALVQVIITVQESYKNVIIAHQGKQVAEQALDNTVAELDIVEARYAAGTASELSLLEAQNEVLNVKSQLLAATNGFDLALTHILQILDVELSHHDSVDAWVTALTDTINLDLKPWEVDFYKAVEYGVENRVEVDMLNQQLAMAELELDAYDKGNDWSANLNGHYVVDQVVLQGGLNSDKILTGTIAYSDTKLPNYGDESSDQDMTNPWQITAGVTYTFGGGGTRDAEVQRLETAVAKVNLQLETLRDGLYLDIYNNYQQLDQAWNQYQLALQSQRQVEKTIANLQRMYELGSITEPDLNDGKLYFAQAQSQVLSSVLNYQTKVLQLANALGADTNEMLQLLGSEYYMSSE